MHSNPILIIVPTLDSFKILNNLISSIQSQTYKNWRVIFIDGNSNDQHKSYLNRLCQKEKKFVWYQQSGNYKYIFGAMNQGLQFAKFNEWVLFLGSDDCLSSKCILEAINKKIIKLEEKGEFLDLIIGAGRYVNRETNKLGRISKFFNILNFRTSLFLGITPPHQATILGPKARRFLGNFSERITLTADLDYFLKLSLKKDLKFELINEQIVYMGDGGVSGRNITKRIKQVMYCYFKSFKLFAIIPFVFRYFFRTLFLLKDYWRK